MKSISKKIALLGLTFMYTTIFCNAISKDSVAVPVDYQLLPIRYTEFQLSNPTSYINLKGSSLDINLNYKHTSGEYKTVSDATSINEGGLNMQGFKQIDKYHFYGSFSYNIAGLKGQNWKDVLMTSANNPFILADSIGGDYDNEGFKIKAAMASSINEKISWGLVLDYEGGSSADQTDPRPSIDAVRYVIRPGISYTISPSWGIGLDVAYHGYREKISISSLESMYTYRFFMMQGLGNAVVESSTGGYSREYTGHIWDANIQLNWNNRNLKNSLQFGYKNNHENSEDGSNSRYKSGDYAETIYSVSDVFSFKQAQGVHIAKIEASRAESKGTWYDQQKTVNSNDQIVWEVYNKSVKYKNDITQAKFDYSYVKEKDEMINLLLGASVDYEQNNTTFYPDVTKQKYSNVRLEAKGIKTFWLPNKFQIETTLNVNYKKNLNSNFDFYGIPLASSYSLPIYEYLTSDNYGGALGLKLSKRTVINKRVSLVYLAIRGDYTQSNLKTTYFDKDNRLGILATIGTTF